MPAVSEHQPRPEFGHRADCCLLPTSLLVREVAFSSAGQAAVKVQHGFLSCWPRPTQQVLALAADSVPQGWKATLQVKAGAAAMDAEVGGALQGMCCAGQFLPQCQAAAQPVVFLVFILIHI